jgi:hypothetical protein
MIESLGKLSSLPADLWDREGCIHFEIDHGQRYLDTGETVSLQVLTLKRNAGRCVLIWKESRFELTESHTQSADTFDKVAADLGMTPINLDLPLPLEPISIPKPWGQEIWYTGIEQRGISTVNGVPIAWLIDLFGTTLGTDKPPLLLKILDPHASANLGDLYFEMHEKKVEVYVVTHVDKDAWPDGKGKIRYGFDQNRIRDYESKDQFLKEYVNRVKAYQAVRTTIDDHLAKQKKERGIAQGEVVSPVIYEALMATVPQELSEAESQLRSDMYELTALRDLQVGDVITVDPFVPHSLQHGVRVVEFQTPHYERYILSFGQQVMTQDHWDTESAIGLAIIDDVSPPKPQSLEQGKDLIADFDAFRVLRVELAAGHKTTIDIDGYAIVMGVDGEMTIRRHEIDTPVRPECAFFISPDGNTIEFTNHGDTRACILLAFETQRD